MEKKLKKPYYKPSINRVKLVPEEAVLTACKTCGRRAPTRPPCGRGRRFRQLGT
ncbi:MAG: hypothetical protein ACE5WD_03600 [Candidatus Aminicenantia bacterium]